MARTPTAQLQAASDWPNPACSQPRQQVWPLHIRGHQSKSAMTPTSARLAAVSDAALASCAAVSAQWPAAISQLGAGKLRRDGAAVTASRHGDEQRTPREQGAAPGPCRAITVAWVSRRYRACGIYIENLSMQTLPAIIGTSESTVKAGSLQLLSTVSSVRLCGG